MSTDTSSTSSTDVAKDAFHEQRLASLELAAPHMDGYEVIELIGEGAYGEVWKARETQTNVTVAIKRLRRQPAGISREDCERLAELSAARGIVALRKVHLDSEPYCYVMEYLTGGTLADLIDKGPLPFDKAWDLFSQLARAMSYVHKDAVVHCDLKPANILLDARGEPRISDFGQARGHGPNGSSLGTRFYMPPEQAREGQPDTCWDVYALGAILYEMLTQKKPYCDETIMGQLHSPSPSNSGSAVRDRLEVYARHLEQSPPPREHRDVPGVDSRVARLIERCLSLDPDARPRDAADVLKRVGRCDRARQLRPLLTYGGFVPAVVMLLLGLWIFFANRWVWGTFEKAWQGHVVESNGAIAESIKSNIVPRFQERLNLVRDVAQDPGLVELMRRDPAVKDEDVQQAVVELYGAHDHKVTPRWSITSKRGDLLYTYGNWVGESSAVGTDDSSNGKNFVWRGWFNGIADHEDKSHLAGDLKAFQKRRRTKAFMSQPYVRIGENQVPAINVSCPIAESDDAEPLGLVAGVFYYDDFIREVEDFVASQGEANRMVFIVNDQKQVIYSPRMVEAAKRGEFKVSALPDDAVIAHAFDDEALPAGGYRNPLGHAGAWNQCLGDRRVVELGNGQRLAIFVQQDRDLAMAPMANLKMFTTMVSLVVFGIGLAYLVFNGLALSRTLRQPQEAPAHA